MVQGRGSTQGEGSGGEGLGQRSGGEVRGRGPGERVSRMESEVRVEPGPVRSPRRGGCRGRALRDIQGRLEPARVDPAWNHAWVDVGGD